VANRPHPFLCRQHSSPHCDTFSNGRLKFKRLFETPVGRNQGIFVISTALPPPSSAQSTSRHSGGVGECGARWVKMEGAFRTPGILTREHLSSGVASATRSAVPRQERWHFAGAARAAHSHRRDRRHRPANVARAYTVASAAAGSACPVCGKRPRLTLKH
jgi:hypothetical protein